MSDFLQGNTCVFGLQWGDEGKGKIVDFVSEHAQVVVRFCGGANAGHTVRIGNQTYKTNLLPAGVFRPGVMSLIGNGVVLDPNRLFEEIDAMLAKGVAVSPQNLRVSYKTHVVMPYHKLEDGAREGSGDAAVLGTTRQGIGPTYADKMRRTSAIRVGELAGDETLLREKIEAIVAERNKVLNVLYGVDPMDPKAIFEQARDFGRRLKPYVDDVSLLLLQATRQGQRIVFEGAQATLLDVDHGTYPYVSSSNCSALGVFAGAGIAARSVQNFVGIMKAYSTRVGGGPFPSEQANQTGDYIRQRGHEYGTTTGRPRRCGWFDAMAARYSADLCGATAVGLTLLDVLGGLEHLRICTGYRYRGQSAEYFRADTQWLAEVEPVYETMPGWKGEISSCRRYDDLPAEAKRYVLRLETLVGVPIRIVSIGPERDATLLR